MHKLYKQKKVFGGLDGLRFLSISAVIWHHSVGSLSSFTLTQYGFLGVDLFFVISGFLIVTLLLRERDKNGSISLRSFYIRRSLRIFPLYYGFILGLAAIYYFLYNQSEFGIGFLNELPIYLFYLANIFPVSLNILWSLASEEQFYLVWPFIETYLEKHIFILIYSCLIVNQLFNFYHKEISEWMGIEDMSIFQTTFTPILLGVLLAHLLNNKPSFRLIAPWIRSYYCSLLWLFGLIITCSLLPNDISGMPRLFVQIIMTLLVGSVVINENNVLMPLLLFPPFARVGVISYGVYLFHIHGIVIAEKLLQKVGIEQGLIVFIFGYSITILIAETSYRLYEMPFLKLKARFSKVQQTHM